jgi:hypothetical protein
MSDVLGVMRLADMHKVHPEQDNSHVCAVCGHRVGVYPSGQRVKAQPRIRLVCNHCLEPDPAEIYLPAPGAFEEMRESVPAKKA